MFGTMIRGIPYIEFKAGTYYWLGDNNKHIFPLVSNFTSKLQNLPSRYNEKDMIDYLYLSKDVLNATENEDTYFTVNYRTFEDEPIYLNRHDIYGLMGGRKRVDIAYLSYFYPSWQSLKDKIIIERDTFFNKLMKKDIPLLLTLTFNEIPNTQNLDMNELLDKLKDMHQIPFYQGLKSESKKDKYIVQYLIEYISSGLYNYNLYNIDKITPKGDEINIMKI